MKYVYSTNIHTGIKTYDLDIDGELQQYTDEEAAYQVAIMSGALSLHTTWNSEEV